MARSEDDFLVGGLEEWSDSRGGVAGSASEEDGHDYGECEKTVGLGDEERIVCWR